MECKIYNQYGIYGNLDDYEKYVDDAYSMGEEISRGRPFEIEVKIVGGTVMDFFEVVKESCLRIDVYIFDSEMDRDIYLMGGA